MHGACLGLYLCAEGRELRVHHGLHVHVEGGLDLHRPAIELQDGELDDFLEKAKKHILL